MKWNNFRRAMQDDFMGASKWFESFYGLYNQVIDDLNEALNNGLKIEDNFVGAKMTVNLTHGTAKTIKVRTLSVPVSCVFPGMCSTPLSQPLAVQPAGNGAFTVTANFVGSPTAEQSVILYILG